MGKAREIAMPNPADKDTCEAANALAEAQNADVFLYNAPIERGFDRKVIGL